MKTRSADSCLQLFFAVLMALSLGACKPTGGAGDKPDESASGASKAVRAKAKAKLKKIAALYAKAKAVPPVETNSPDLPNKLSVEQFELMGIGYLKDLEREVDRTKELKFEPTMLSLCASGVAKKDDKLAEYVEKCSKLEYVAVIRQQKLRLPSVDMATNTFTSGSFDGDALLYEIDSGKLKGSYTIYVGNDPKIESETDKSKEDWESSAIIDLAGNAESRAREHFSSI
jgi:hypothetical protein